MRMASLVLLSMLVLTLATAAVAQVLKTEPRMGALREGQVVLVDDGTCPAGQIKQVIGGNHVEWAASNRSSASAAASHGARQADILRAAGEGDGAAHPASAYRPGNSRRARLCSHSPVLQELVAIWFGPETPCVPLED